MCDHSRRSTVLTARLGEELDTARTAHKDEILLLQDLHRNLIDIKDRIKLDEERVRMEQEKLIEAEEAVRHQEERLRLTFEQLELHEGRYQAKGGQPIPHVFRAF